MAAAKVLKYGLGLRNPETLEAVGFAAGTKKSDLPDWAKELVQDDDFEGADEAESAGSGSGSGSSSTPEDKGYAGQTPDELKAEVEKRELTVTGTGASGNVKKGDLVAALEADDAAKAAAAQS